MNKFILSVVVAGVSIGAAVAGPGGGKGPGGNGGGNGGGKPSGGNSHPSFPSHVSHSPSNNHWGMSSSFKGSNFSSKGNYHVNFGKSFSHGFFYQGKNHNHWSFSCYWPKYGCNTYWCPSACCYYYWCEPASCYYPISYVSYAPPTQVQVQVTTPVTIAAPVAPAPAPYVAPAPVQTQTQTQTQTQAQGVGGPPAGYPPLPQ
jgi:hypothetical protein